MKKFFTFDIKINEKIKYNLATVLKEINVIENVSAKVEKETIKIKYLAEEIASGNRDDAEDIRDKVLKVTDRYKDLEDKKEDEKNPEKVMGDEKAFQVVLDPTDVSKLTKVNDAGIEYAVTEPATVEVKEKNYSKFIMECSKLGIGIRDVYLKENYIENSKVYDALEIGLKLGEEINSEYIKGAIFGVEGKKIEELDNFTKNELKKKFPNLSKVLGL